MRRMLVILALENTTTREKAIFPFGTSLRMEYQYGSLEERFCEQNSDYGRGIFISISGALVGNVLSPCGEKENNIQNF